MQTRPFRFALTIGDARDRSSFTEMVRRAEDTGFHVLAGVDHIGPPLGVLPMLATAAEVSQLRVSSMVIANDYGRHPVLLASDAATIDVLSEGRFELGIGTGWIKAQYESAGLPYEEPGVRVDRLTEAIAVIKGCWRGEEFTFRGTHYQVDLTGGPVPVQRPHPPLLIAGAGPRMLKLAGQEADIVGITLTYGHSDFDTFGPAIATSGARIADQLSWVREGAGDRFASVELSVMVHHVVAGSDHDQVAQPLADPTRATENQVLDSPHMLVGPMTRMVDTLVERRERLGLSYVVFRGAHFDDIAPVVSQLSGT